MTFFQHLSEFNGWIWIHNFTYIMALLVSVSVFPFGLNTSSSGYCNLCDKARDILAMRTVAYRAKDLSLEAYRAKYLCMGAYRAKDLCTGAYRAKDLCMGVRLGFKKWTPQAD
jgi:hypothetical protein